MSNPKIFLQPELIEGDNIDIAQDGKTISSNTPLENITDTEITEVEDGQALIYDETSGKWVNGEGGTPIEPNPAAAATDTLSTIKIDNTVFTIGGGGTGDAVLYPLTTAEYNALTPEQKMDENVLYLLTDGGSGGGGGTGSGYSETTLWENASGQSFVNSPAITLTLNDDISNYDMLMFELAPSNNPTWRYHNIALTQNIDKTGANYFGSITVGGTEGYAPGIAYVDETSLSFHSWGQAYSLTIYKIIGIKYGGGGGTGNLNAVEMDYEDWLALPQEEREDPDIEYFLSNAPGGSSGSGELVADVIWEGPSTPTTSGTVITLDKSWEDYDFLVFELKQGSNYLSTPMIYLKNIETNVRYIQSGYGYGRFDVVMTLLTSTTMKIERTSSSGVETTYSKIYGLKFNNGSGSGSSKVIPNPQGEATDTLNTVEIDGTIYELSGEEYEAGENISITNNVISATDTTYTAGTNIQINAQNEISAHENMTGETIPTSSEGNNNAIYIQYSTTGGETDYETIWTGSISTSAWASPVQIGTINPSEYYRIKITGTGNGERLVSEIPVVGSGDLWHLGHEMYIFTANDCTELWLYSSTGYANTVTKVEATTYDEKMVDSIEKVYGKIKDDWYEIATNVVPNPQGTATDTLNTVEIDGTIYDLPSGGGGGGGSGYSETTLWENASGLSFNANNQQTVTLSDNISNYDMLCLIYRDSTYVTDRSISMYPVSEIDTAGSIGFWLTPLMPENNLTSPRSYYVSDNQVRLAGVTTRVTMVAFKIIGIKFGGGGGATFEGLDYSNATDLTLPDNTGYTYTPSEDGVIMVTAYGNVGALSIQQDNFEAIHLAHGSDRWTTAWCFVEKGVNYTLSSTSRSNSWPSGSWAKFIPLKQSSSGGGGSSEVNYSTEEQVIGTWIDGKPLYQKTIHTSGISLKLNGTYDFTSLFPLTNTVRDITVIGNYLDNDSPNYFSLGLFCTYFNPNEAPAHTLRLNMGSSTRTLEFFITIKYTKTTD